MSKLVKQLFDEVNQLSPEDQETFAAWMLKELRSEQRWQELFARSPDLLEKLAEEGLAEYRAGRTLPLDP